MIKEKDDTQNKLMQLQMLQQRLQVFAGQKQQLQIQQIEIENALNEVSKSKKDVYSLIGGIMIERNAKDVEKELNEKNSDITIKLESLEKQEESTRKKAESLQEEVTKKLK